MYKIGFKTMKYYQISELMIQASQYVSNILEINLIPSWGDVPENVLDSICT